MSASARPKAAAAESDNAPTFTITELAQEFDITPRAIRFYEDVGCWSPRAPAATASTPTATARA
jgi:hypothetical protein